MANQIEELESVVKGTLADGDFYFDADSGVVRVNSLFSRWSPSAMVPLLFGLVGLVAAGVWFFVGTAATAWLILVGSLIPFGLFALTFSNPGFVVDIGARLVRYKNSTVPFMTFSRGDVQWSAADDEIKVWLHSTEFRKLLATFRASELPQARQFVEQIWSILHTPDSGSVVTYGSTLTPVQWWIQGANAIFTTYWEFPLSEYGPGPGPLQGVGRAAITRALERDWGVRDLDGLLAQVDSLVRHGHRETYASQGLDGNFLIWDYARVLWLYRVGHIVGWLPAEVCWDAVLPLARDIQRHYSSWQDMNHWYLQGRRIWAAAADTDDQDEREAIAERLAADPRSPWNFVDWNLPLHKDWH